MKTIATKWKLETMQNEINRRRKLSESKTMRMKQQLKILLPLLWLRSGCFFHQICGLIYGIKIIRVQSNRVRRRKGACVCENAI